MYRVILKNKRDYYNRLFALCKSCYWTATFFARMEKYECPVCLGANVELMPLNMDEKYEYELEPKRGLEIKFSINEEIGILDI